MSAFKPRSVLSFSPPPPKCHYSGVSLNRNYFSPLILCVMAETVGLLECASFQVAHINVGCPVFRDLVIEKQVTTLFFPSSSMFYIAKKIIIVVTIVRLGAVGFSLTLTVLYNCSYLVY